MDASDDDYPFINKIEPFIEIPHIIWNRIRIIPFVPDIEIYHPTDDF